MLPEPRPGRKRSRISLFINILDNGTEILPEWHTPCDAYPDRIAASRIRNSQIAGPQGAARERPSRDQGLSPRACARERVRFSVISAVIPQCGRRSEHRSRPERPSAEMSREPGKSLRQSCTGSEPPRRESGGVCQARGSPLFRRAGSGSPCPILPPSHILHERIVRIPYKDFSHSHIASGSGDNKRRAFLAGRAAPPPQPLSRQADARRSPPPAGRRESGKNVFT